MKNCFRMPVACHLILCQGDEILLLLRANTGYEDGKHSVVAGHVEERESASAAMIREAREEAGVTIAQEDLVFGCVMHRKPKDGERIDFFYVCNKWQGEIQNKEPHKCGGLSFFPLSQLPDTTIPYVRAGIEAWRTGITYVEFGWEKEL